MSGGYFGYNQSHVQYLADDIEHHIHKHGDSYTPETIEKFREGVTCLRKAYVYAQRIDWLLSGDDGEEAFHRWLKEALEEING